MLQLISSHMHVKSLSIEGECVCGGGGGGGGGARSKTINNLLSNQDLDVGEGEEDWCQLPLCTCDSTCPLAFSPFNIVNIEDSDWLEPSIFNSLTHSF